MIFGAPLETLHVSAATKAFFGELIYGFMRVRRNIYLFTSILITCLFVAGCDPYYPIIITNETSNEVLILVKENIKFQTKKEKNHTTEDGYDVYKLASKEQVIVGHAIAELDNDIPFETIRIITSNDTVSAGNLEEIKKLFDKKTFGGLKKPYNISIK